MLHSKFDTLAFCGGQTTPWYFSALIFIVMIMQENCMTAKNHGLLAIN